MCYHLDMEQRRSTSKKKRSSSKFKCTSTKKSMYYEYKRCSLHFFI